MQVSHGVVLFFSWVPSKKVLRNPHCSSLAVAYHRTIDHFDGYSQHVADSYAPHAHTGIVLNETCRHYTSQRSTGLQQKASAQQKSWKG